MREPVTERQPDEISKLICAQISLDSDLVDRTTRTMLRETGICSPADVFRAESARAEGVKTLLWLSVQPRTPEEITVYVRERYRLAIREVREIEGWRLEEEVEERVQLYGARVFALAIAIGKRNFYSHTLQRLTRELWS